MATEHTLYLIMYDITNSKILQKVAKLIQQHGFERVNYSVWIGNYSPLENPLLEEQINQLLETDEAKGSEFFIIPISRKNIRKMKSYTREKPYNLDYWLGDKPTLFF